MENILCDPGFILLFVVVAIGALAAFAGLACLAESRAAVWRRITARIREHGKRAREEMNQASADYLQEVYQRASKESQPRR